MSDATTGGAAPAGNNADMSGTAQTNRQGAESPSHTPFPYARLFYSIGYGFLAWFVVHIVFVLAIVQFIVIAINGRANEELKRFSRTLIQYLWELLAFITVARDEQPFPMGPFPSQV